MIGTFFRRVYSPIFAKNGEEPAHKNFFVSLNGRVMLPRTEGAKFIVFEGLEGSGQSTQASLIRDHLEEKGFDVLITKEPTVLSEAGRKALKALNREIVIGFKELQELFAEDRREHLDKVIIPALKEGRTVISDRYFLSALAYGSLDCSLKWLMEINGNFILPDATFVLHVPPGTCYDRIKERHHETQLFEERERLEKALKAYEKLARMFDDVYLVNGEQSIENVFYAVLIKILKI